MTESITGDDESEKIRMSLGIAQADAHDAVRSHVFKRGGRIPRAHQGGYKKMCEEWRILGGQMNDRQCVVAIKFRLKGTAYDLAAKNATPPEAPPYAYAAGSTPEMTAGGTAETVADNPEFWNKHWTYMNAFYIEESQRWNAAFFDQFCEYCRKQGGNVQEFIAEYDLRNSEATAVGRTLDPTMSS